MEIKIETEALIDKLIQKPTNDFEIGVNFSIIGLLKESAIQTEDMLLSKIASSFKNAGLLNFWMSIKEDKIKNIALTVFFKNFDKESKLAMVKSLKEITGLGLKDSKDIVDHYSTLV